MSTGRIVSTQIARADLLKWGEEQFGDWIKAVVDMSRGIMAVGGDLHADDEALLLADGSRLQNLWGINLYPEDAGPDWIEFDSMINIRPRDGNRSRRSPLPGSVARPRGVLPTLLRPRCAT